MKLYKALEEEAEVARRTEPPETVALLLSAMRAEKAKEASGINPEEFNRAYAQMEAEARA